MTSPSTLRPFTVAVPEPDLDDLRQRLAHTRWPSDETVPDWSQGVRTSHLRSLVDAWARDHDWRRFEAELNRHPQFLTTIDGLDVHFLHVRSPNPGAVPLLLTHGWPGSVADYLPLIGPLTDPAAFGGDAADSFDVVIPSLPGFGFSGTPTGTGWTVERTARAWAELMSRLGYERWAAQGGDWGAAVTTALGALRPEGLLGLHLTTPFAVPAPLPAVLAAEEHRAVESLAHYAGELGGANHLQATRPQTIGVALADSPAGQLAWVYDKLQSKTDHPGRVEDALGLDAVLDLVSLFWLTNTAASSGRTYWENRSSSFTGPRLTLPVAVTVFPKDVPLLPRSWVEATYADLVHFGAMPRGGHFAALEQPELLVGEIRTGLRAVRVSG